jgi:lipoyl-dependent peroxiredoxin
MISRVVYTTEATVEGGRGGHAWTSDGRLDVELDVPAELGGFGGPGTNPEQLFAAAYAACFHSSLLRVAAGRQVALPTSRVTATVGIGPADDGGFGIAVVLDLEAPAIERAEGALLMERAHELCPYSRATRGNVDVVLSFGGAPFERIAA